MLETITLEALDPMPWSKTDDAFLTSPRMTRAANLIGRHGRSRALGVWMEGVFHSLRHLTDGFVADADLDLFIMENRPTKRRAVAQALVDAELWERIATPTPGYRIKGFLDHYPDAETIRQRIAEKQARRRATTARPSAGAKRKRNNAPRTRAGAGSRAPGRESETETDTSFPPNPPPGGENGAAAPEGVEPDPVDVAEHLRTSLGAAPLIPPEERE